MIDHDGHLDGVRPAIMVAADYASRFIHARSDDVLATAARWSVALGVVAVPPEIKAIRAGRKMRVEHRSRRALGPRSRPVP